MSCNCTRVCSIPKCIEIINAGTIDPNITAIVQFKEIITGRIKQVQTVVYEEGALQVDVTALVEVGFFSENMVYEMTILASNANQCDTTSWAIDETENIECVLLTFVNIGVESPTVTLKIAE